MTPGVAPSTVTSISLDEHFVLESGERVDGEDGVAASIDSAMLDRLRLERFAEGLSIQILHLGPYSEEPRTLEKMAAFASANDYVFHGRHHEIYLGDPRTAKQENLRTVLRHAVKKVDERSGE